MGGSTAARRAAALVVLCAALAWAGMRNGRVPVLSLVDLGFHELGHLLCYVADAFLPWSEAVTAAAGSVTQVAVPAGLAAYFLRRSDQVGGVFCLAWTATNLHDVARYVADAPYERLPLIGGAHDWAYVLRDHLDRAADLASALRTVGWIVLFAAVATAVWPLLATPRPTQVPRSARR